MAEIVTSPEELVEKLGLMPRAHRKTDRRKALGKAICGKYPPVPFYKTKNGPRQMIGYEYPTLHGWGENAEAKAKLITDNGRGTLSEWGGSCTVYTFGLASFFMPRYNGTAERGPQAF